MFEVEVLKGGPLCSNAYVLTSRSSNACWLVDLGDFSMLDGLIAGGAEVKGVFLTHTHFDHIAGIGELCEHFPGCAVYTSEYGKEALRSPKQNLSYYNGCPFSYEGQNVVVLHDGDKVQLFEDVYMNAVETPGHCPSCLTYYTEEALFSGDSYIPGVPVVTKLPRGDRSLANRSWATIKHLAESRQAYPGHTV